MEEKDILKTSDGDLYVNIDKQLTEISKEEGDKVGLAFVDGMIIISDPDDVNEAEDMLRAFSAITD